MSTLRTSRLARAVALVLLGSLVAAGCGGDDDNGGGGSGTTRQSEGGTTSTSEPGGTEPADVQPYISDLLARLDDVTDQIVRDPSVALDPDSELIQEFTALYAPHSEGLDGGLSAFRQAAEEGTRLEPLDSERTIQRTLTGDIETVDEDRVRFPLCSTMTHRKLDRAGGVIEHIPHLAHPGEGFAVRVDGEWRLERIDVFTNTVCPEEAT